MGSQVTRREVILGTGAAFLLALIDDESLGLAQKRRKRSRRPSPHKKSRRTKERATPAKHVAAGPISGESLYRDVIAYYNIGEHRTATEADLKTSDWIAKELRAAGVPTTFQRFTVDQFFPRVTNLRIGETTVRAFPLWPPHTTGPEPIRAKLTAFSRDRGPRSLQGAIALVRFPFDPRAAVFNRSGHAEIIHAAAKSGASAVVAVTEGPTSEIIALNVEPGVERWPVPAVLVAPRDEALLSTSAVSGVEAALLVDGRYDPAAEGRNVIGRVSRGEQLVVVSTPQSGWFRCAAERGPGVALFLGLARWAAKRPSGPSFLFVSTSGHELGGLGMRAFQTELAPRPDRVLCWAHLGAGIAAFQWEATEGVPHRLREADSNRYLMSTKELEPLLSETFAGLPGLTPKVGRAVGEFEFMLKAGYRSFGIAAAHRFHHTPADSPEMTGPEILEPVATALVRTLEAIA